MARKAVHLDLVLLQSIIDEEKNKPDSLTKGIMSFYDRCSQIYNDRVKPEVPLYDHLLYLRVFQGKLKFEFQNTVAPQVKELYEQYKPLMNEINLKSNTNFDLQINLSRGLLTNFKNSPSLSLDNLKIFLIGLGTVAGVDEALLQRFVDDSLHTRSV